MNDINELNLICQDNMLKNINNNSDFLVVCYDLPSENSKEFDRKCKTDAEFELIKQTKSLIIQNRMAVSYIFNLAGVRLNKSVYVIHKDKIESLFFRIEEIYHGVPKKYFKKVNIKIIGSVFKNLIEKLLESDFEANYNKLKSALELLDADLNFAINNNELYEKRRKSLIKKTYSLSVLEMMMQARVDDLVLVAPQKKDFYSKRIESLKYARKNILKRII